MAHVVLLMRPCHVICKNVAVLYSGVPSFMMVSKRFRAYYL